MASTCTKKYLDSNILFTQMCVRYCQMYKIYSISLFSIYQIIIVSYYQRKFKISHFGDYLLFLGLY